jgi:hypothetical protein
MYEVGQTLSLQLMPSEMTVEVRIHSMPTKFTLSAVIVVDTISQPDSCDLPERAFLKLYDNRHCHQLHDDYEVGEWTPEIDAQMLEFSRSGGASAFFAYYYDDSIECEAEPEPWGQTEKEAGLWDEMSDDYERESKTYEVLRKHQGSLIPKLYSKVEYSTNPADDLGGYPELFTAPGILLEFIDGVRMTDVHEHFGQSELNYIIDRGARTSGAVFTLSPMLNEDSRTGNISV